MANKKQHLAEGLGHCSAKVNEITNGPLADPAAWPADRRWWLQLGFNLGRYSELSEEGRQVWDDWRAAIEQADTRHMAELAHLMHQKAVEANQVESG